MVNGTTQWFNGQGQGRHERWCNNDNNCIAGIMITVIGKENPISKRMKQLFCAAVRGGGEEILERKKDA